MRKGGQIFEKIVDFLLLLTLLLLLDQFHALRRLVLAQELHFYLSVFGEQLQIHQFVYLVRHEVLVLRPEQLSRVLFFLLHYDYPQSTYFQEVLRGGSFVVHLYLNGEGGTVCHSLFSLSEEFLILLLVEFKEVSLLRKQQSDLFEDKQFSLQSTLLIRVIDSTPLLLRFIEAL